MSKKDSSKNLARNIIIIFISFITVLFVSLGIYVSKSNKEKENDKNLIGYTIKEEVLVDTCNLVNVEGFYLGKGNLNNETHYIFQVEKNNQFSNNIDATDKSLEIIYVPKDTIKNDEAKPGTIKAYSRTYVKRDTNNKVIKTQNVYFYKVYIPENTIKDCGVLTDKNENNSESEE